MRRILHIDMDAFFAMIEQKRHPELKGRPVVVGGSGDPTKRGVVSTASYEARKFGIHSAMPLRTAYGLCPGAVFLPVDYETYSTVSHEIKGILGRFSPALEDVGIDEAFLDISSIERPPEEIARDIKEAIRDRTGLTCSIGIAPNKLLAKMASDLRKPDGLTILAEGDLERLIWPLPVRKLYGVGPKTEARLKKMGIETIGRLASLPLERIAAAFGRSYGLYLHEASRGIDESPVVTHWEPRSMSRETTFETDVASWQVLAATLTELVEDVAAGMKESAYRARTVTVKLRFSDFKTLTRAMTLSRATDSSEAIKDAAFRCVSRIVFKKRVRLIGVRLSNLEKRGEDSPVLPHS